MGATWLQFFFACLVNFIHFICRLNARTSVYAIRMRCDRALSPEANEQINTPRPRGLLSNSTALHLLHIIDIQEERTLISIKQFHAGWAAKSTTNLVPSQVWASVFGKYLLRGKFGVENGKFIPATSFFSNIQETFLSATATDLVKILTATLIKFA